MRGPVSELQRDARWRRRIWLAVSVRVLAFGVPIALAVGLTALANWLLPVPETAGQRVAWWVLLLLVVASALIIGDRLARRLLPLAAFLELSLAFPDRAPSRFRVALRSGSARRLGRRVEELRRTGPEGDPSVAARGVLELVAMLTAHDRGTRGHSERVRAYTDLLADEMGLAPAERDRLRWAALLHDVGKVAVPAEVLNKPGPLDTGERQLVNAHPLEGERLTVSLRSWLGEWASAVGQHHEWWNGTGYPRGLRGSEISLGARIVAVADAFEVMTAPRPYKQPMTADAARRELVRAAAVQFDPVVVRALLDISLGKLHSAMGLVGLLGLLPFVRRIAAKPFARGAVTAVVTGGTLVAGALVDVPPPRHDSVQVLGTVERRPAPRPGAPTAPVEEPPSPPSVSRPAPTALTPPPAPPRAPPPGSSAPVPVASFPDESPARPVPLPEEPVMAEPAGERGPCTTFFNGSGSGRAHKRQAPPARALAESAGAIGQTVAQYCGVAPAATGIVADLGQVGGSPEFEDPVLPDGSQPVG